VCVLSVSARQLMFAESGEERDPCRHRFALAEKAMSHHEWITMRVARPSCLLRFECFISDYSQIALNDSQIILRLTPVDRMVLGQATVNETLQALRKRLRFGAIGKSK
jgi:hypothetical protein